MYFNVNVLTRANSQSVLWLTLLVISLIFLRPDGVEAEPLTLEDVNGGKNIQTSEVD